MAQGILQDMMANAMLVKDLAEVAKDTALLHGVQIRVHESPNSSEVKTKHYFMFECTEGKSSNTRLVLGWRGGAWSLSLPSGEGLATPLNFELCRLVKDIETGIHFHQCYCSKNKYQTIFLIIAPTCLEIIIN